MRTYLLQAMIAGGMIVNLASPTPDGFSKPAGFSPSTGISFPSEGMKVLTEMCCLCNIETAAIISRDGLLIKAIPENTDLANLAAMGATILGAAEAASSEAGKGIPERIIVEAGNSSFIVMGAGPKMLLAAIIENGVDLELALYVMEKAAEKIKCSHEK